MSLVSYSQPTILWPGSRAKGLRLESRRDFASAVEVAKQYSLFIAFFVAALTLIEDGFIVLWSLWVYPSDILIPIKIALVLGYVFFLTQTGLRIQPLFDNERNLHDRIIAFIFVPITLGSIYVGMGLALPDIINFLVHTSLPLQLLSLSVSVKLMISTGVFVIFAVLAIFLRNIGFGFIGYLWEVKTEKLERKRRGLD